MVLISGLLIDLGAGLFLSSTNYADFRCPDPYYHHGLLPNRESVARWGNGPEYAVFTNSLGFFDRAVNRIPLTTSKKRIVFIGDSYTEGIGFPYGKTFVGLLDDRIDHERTEILNAAVVSYCPKLYYLKIQYLLEEAALRFDELYVFIDISDIQDEVLYRTFTPRKPATQERIQVWVDDSLTSASFTYNVLRHLYRSRELTERKKRYDADLHPPWINYYWLDNVDEEPVKDPMFVNLRHAWTFPKFFDSRWTQQGIQLAVLHMEHLVELCKRNGVDITIFVYPWLPQIFEHDLNSQHVKLWQRFAREKGIGFIDLFPVFINNVPPQMIQQRYFIQGDQHWNEEGHRLVAERVLPYLLE